MPGVSLVSRNLRDNKIFSIRGTGERTLSIDFIGIDQYFAEVYSIDLVAGRKLEPADAKATGACACLAGTLQENFLAARIAVNKLLFLEQDVFEVVGVVSGVMLGSWSQGCAVRSLSCFLQP